MPIEINVIGQIARLTCLRGWLLIALVAAGAYLLLGVVGVFAWVAGVVSGLSASTPWEVETDDEPRVEPMSGGPAIGLTGASAPGWWKRYSEPDSRLRFERLCSIDSSLRARLRLAYS
jgi:hypothetical protein